MTQQYEWRPDASLSVLRARAELLAAIRAFFAERGVLEVDTPVLAAAAPSEAQLACFPVGDGAGYLVPSSEHALKRLLAAGAGSLYQLGHAFRAGEAGRWHNPEFTMLEWYRPGGSVTDLIDEVGELLTQVAGTSAPIRTTFAMLFDELTGLDAHRAPPAKLAEYADNAGLTPEHVTAAERDSRAFWLDLIMSVEITPALGFGAPVCVEAFPADDAVLVAVTDDKPPVAERFEIYWRGHELANGARELTAPAPARERMQREQDKRVAADMPAPPIDEKLLAAMAEGLPECVGVALGVDRLLALQQGEDSLAAVLPFGWERR